MLTFGLDLASNAKIIRSVDDTGAAGVTFPALPIDGQVFLLTADSQGKEAGLYVYLETKLGWFPQLDDSNAYDVSINVNRRFMQNDVLTTFLVPRVIKVPANFKGSGAVAQITATAAVEFKVFVESGSPVVKTLIGTINFTAGGRVGTVSPAAPNTVYVLVQGDLLTVESGPSVDKTLNKLSVTIATSLIV